VYSDLNGEVESLRDGLFELTNELKKAETALSEMENESHKDEHSAATALSRTYDVSTMKYFTEFFFLLLLFFYYYLFVRFTASLGRHEKLSANAARDRPTAETSERRRFEGVQKRQENVGERTERDGKAVQAAQAETPKRVKNAGERKRLLDVGR